MPKVNQKSSDTTGVSVSTDPQAIPEKKRGRPKGSKNKAIRSDHAITVEPGDNATFLLHDMKIAKLPRIDLNNDTAVQERIDYFFSLCASDNIRPSIEGLALAFGMSRMNLFQWLNGDRGKLTNENSVYSIKQAYNIINNYYAHMMNNGKINPVAGIFLMKNNMGYKDTTDYIVTTGNNTDPSLQDISDKAGLLSD